MRPAPGARTKVRSWKDVQLIISSMSVAVTLGLWSLWAAREKTAAAVQAEAALPSVSGTPATGPTLLPGQTIYLAGPTPQAQNQVSVKEKRKHRRGGDGGGGGGGGADAATGSS